ncbi:hypothetical protein [Streptomyces sp. SID3343]|uniref:hypothetical protein n=1 Tax=Streptomyces sp. SID3343 TaxID=2690260 RepID=UPI0013718D10|nr:hypothetical protein [Streptomyces sp. SID3343]MYW03467.1 hypothetical protein [Streptomyces sp. SID3343]
MARTLITAAVITSEDGTDPTAADVAANLVDGSSFAWARGRLLYLANGDSTALTVTAVTAATVGRGGRAVADASGTVPAAGWRLFGPFGSEFRQADGMVHIDYTGADALVTALLVDVPGV